MDGHPVAPVTWWARRLLSGQPHQVIGGRSEYDDNHPYMLRWWLLPRNPWVKVYVHKFLRSDEDRALHDHPWSFVSLVLRGFYIEHQPDGQRLREPGSIAYRAATTRHRVELLRGQPCWTLILTGPKVREWGFWCVRPLTGMAAYMARAFRVPEHMVQEAKFVHWRDWDDAKGCGEFDG